MVDETVEKLEQGASEILAMIQSDKKHSLDDYFQAIRAYLEDDLAKYTTGRGPDHGNPLVVECIEAAINHVGDASMAYYASFK